MGAMTFLKQSRSLGALFAGVILGVGVMIGLMLAANFSWLIPGDISTKPRSSPFFSKIDKPSAGPGPNSFVGVAEFTTPAVVNISASRIVRERGNGPRLPFFEDPFFREFFGEDFLKPFELPRERREQSLGSGVIVDPDGLIITNNHVVAKADEIKILLSDKREYSGRVIGTDPKSDLAVVRIKARNLPFIPWGDSDELQVGEYVLAIGNPFGLNQTVTMGIVSAVGRANIGIAEYEDFIQTDAAIHRGNSGGALVNIAGELIGINTAIMSRSGGYMGIGFAVPSNMARSVLDKLVKTGKVIRGWLGVSIQEVTADLAKEFELSGTGGALVSEVMEGSPAEKAELRKGDVIVSYNGKSIKDLSSLRNVVAETDIGTKVKMTVIRDKKKKRIEVVIEEQPNDFGRFSKRSSGGSEGRDRTALAGLTVTDLTPDLARRLRLPRTETGVVITRVGPGSPGMKAGLRRGDLIVELNRKPIGRVEEYDRVAATIKKKDTVLLLIKRQGRNIFLTLKP